MYVLQNGGRTSLLYLGPWTYEQGQPIHQIILLKNLKVYLKKKKITPDWRGDLNNSKDNQCAGYGVGKICRLRRTEPHNL